MATLNPQSLVTLWQIEQYGSFSATAKATGWSQPAISQQIKKLEAQCGSTLVQRTSHGVEPVSYTHLTLPTKLEV